MEKADSIRINLAELRLKKFAAYVVHFFVFFCMRSIWLDLLSLQIAQVVLPNFVHVLVILVCDLGLMIALVEL
jgi:hypothetical protein